MYVPLWEKFLCEYFDDEADEYRYESLDLFTKVGVDNLMVLNAVWYEKGYDYLSISKNDKKRFKNILKQSHGLIWNKWNFENKANINNIKLINLYPRTFQREIDHPKAPLHFSTVKKDNSLLKWNKLYFVRFLLTFVKILGFSCVFNFVLKIEKSAINQSYSWNDYFLTNI